MEKAKLIVHEENGDRAFPVLFNPEQYNLSRAVNYAKLAVPGLDHPIIQFIGGQQTSLSLTLFFDTQNDFVPSGTAADVRTYTKPMMDTLFIDGKLHAPPSVTFCWGSLSFSGVTTDAKLGYTLFLPDGTPVRAKLDLTLEAPENVGTARRHSPFESPDRTKARTLERGADLWRLAHQEYGSARHWRLIAAANGIDNPRACRAGRVVHIPPLP